MVTKLKGISYKSDLANPYNPKNLHRLPYFFFVNKRDRKISHSNYNLEFSKIEVDNYSVLKDSIEFRTWNCFKYSN